MTTLRLATPADAAACLAIYRPFVESTWVTFELEVPAPEDFAERIRTTLDVRPWVVACDADRVIGYAYASPVKDRAAYQWSVETAIYMAESARGQGLGKSLYQGLFRVLRGQGFMNAVGVIALPNPASIALHESLGFERIANLKQIGFKLGGWHDVGWWQLTLGPLPSRPTPPVALRECLPDADRWLNPR